MHAVSAFIRKTENRARCETELSVWSPTFSCRLLTVVDQKNCLTQFGTRVTASISLLFSVTASLAGSLPVPQNQIRGPEKKHSNMTPTKDIKFERASKFVSHPSFLGCCRHSSLACTETCPSIYIRPHATSFPVFGKALHQCGSFGMAPSPSNSTPANAPLARSSCPLRRLIFSDVGSLTPACAPHLI
jgi:hypothetical protein